MAATAADATATMAATQAMAVATVAAGKLGGVTVTVGAPTLSV